MNKNVFTIALAAGALLASGSVLAASWSINTSGSTHGTTGVSLSSSGWSNTDGFDASLSNSQIHNATSPAVSGRIESASTALYSGGLGVANNDAGSTAGTDTSEGSSPEHAVDNDQRYDSVLLSFDNAISLTGVRAGWYSGDSDITVLAYTGGDANFDVNTDLAGLRYDQLLSNGWSLINHYSNIGSSATQTVSTSLFSSFWLVGAYNPTVGSNPQWSLGNDHVKLKYAYGTVCTQGNGQAGSGGTCGGGTPNTGVSEPGSLALAGAALFGLMRVRRRKSN